MSHPRDGRPARGEWRTVQPTPRGEPNLTLLTGFRGPDGMDFDQVVAAVRDNPSSRSKICVLMRYGQQNSRRGVVIEVDESGIMRIGKLAPGTRRFSQHDVIALVHRGTDGQLYAEFAD